MVAVALAALPVATTATSAAAAQPQARVVIVAVPDLRWGDLEVMPRLRAWAASAAAAELSVKTATGSPRCSDGMLTFAAGDRANADRELDGCALTTVELVTAREENRSSKFG